MSKQKDQSEKEIVTKVEEIGRAAKKQKVWLFGLGFAVVLAVIAGATVFILRQDRSSTGFEGVTGIVNNYRDLQANMIGLSQRPYIQLIPKGGGEFTLRLNTLPLSAGDAETRIVLPDGKEVLAAQKIEFGVFPVESGLNYNSTGLAFLSTAFTGAPSYLVNQNFVYLKNATQNITSGDERFTIQSEQLKNAGEIVVMNSAGLPSLAQIEKQVVSTSDPVNPDSASVPLAYQITTNGAVAVEKATISFVWQMPESTVVTPEPLAQPSGSEAAEIVAVEVAAVDLKPTIYGYDESTRRWIALETHQDNNTFQAESNQLYSIFALMQ